MNADQPNGTTRPAAEDGLPLPAAGVVGLVGPADEGAPTWDTDRVWTLPNVLSMLRLAGVPLMVWLILGPHRDLLAVAVLGMAGFSDWLDGFLARRWHQTSRIGQMLDPVADRLYIVAVVICLAVRDIVPWWLVVALVARDVLIFAAVPLLRTRGYSALPVHFLGKAATFNLLYAFPLILLGADDGLNWALAGVLGWAFALWGVGLYWWAGLLYLIQALRLLRDVPPRTRAG